VALSFTIEALSLNSEAIFVCFCVGSLKISVSRGIDVYRYYFVIGVAASMCKAFVIICGGPNPLILHESWVDESLVVCKLLHFSLCGGDSFVHGTQLVVAVHNCTCESFW
jgi:hypothetical protein